MELSTETKKELLASLSDAELKDELEKRSLYGRKVTKKTHSHFYVHSDRGTVRMSISDGQIWYAPDLRECADHLHKVADDIEGL